MSIKNVTAGKNVPQDIYVIIEIPLRSFPVKYEIDKKSNCLYVDRLIPTTMFYPCNYGYINKSLSLDGDPLDVLIPTPYPLISKSIIRARTIGMLNMRDESGIDRKIIAVPHNTVSSEYNHVQEIKDLPDLLIKQIEHFFLHYKDLEGEKWTKIVGWSDCTEAEKEIISSIIRFNNVKKK
ncbi:Inorganic pyrophosphatase [Buchnera aphidicola (Anoecia corni)]|uniref:Inorganic pyrophosphatase n=1 Tax=Buchnera aphidicola (Anoecia corni) TaxID=2994477 RepID=A0AAT9IG57_9GAMM